MKRKIFKRDNLAVWCSNYPTWIIRIIIVIMFPVALLMPLWTDRTLRGMVKEWFEMAVGKYE